MVTDGAPRLERPAVVSSRAASRWTTWLLIAFGALGCGQPGAPTNVDVAATTAEATTSGAATASAGQAASGAPSVGPAPSESATANDADLPVIRSLGDLEKHAGKRARVLGRYQVTPVPGSKRLQPASIVLEDGTRLLRSYRPVLEELHLDGQRVVVIGKATLDADEGPNVQQVMAPHVRPESVSLDPIESPYAQGARQVRTPPTLASAKDASPHRDLWVQVFGTLASLVVDPKETTWVGMIVTLPDGSEIEAGTIARSRVEKLVGKRVSFIALVEREQPTTGRPRVEPTHVVCEGTVARCGMDGR